MCESEVDGFRADETSSTPLSSYRLTSSFFSSFANFLSSTTRSKKYSRIYLFPVALPSSICISTSQLFTIAFGRSQMEDDQSKQLNKLKQLKNSESLRSTPQLLKK